MALGIMDNFDYKGKNPDFKRSQFTTLAEMKAVSDSDMDEGHIAYCLEDENHYKFNSSNTIDDITGKWRILININISTKKYIETVTELPEVGEENKLYIVVNSESTATSLTSNSTLNFDETTGNLTISNTSYDDSTGDLTVTGSYNNTTGELTVENSSGNEPVKVYIYVSIIGFIKLKLEL